MKKVIKAEKSNVIRIDEIKNMIDNGLEFVLLGIEKEDKKVRFLKYRFDEIESGWSSLFCWRGYDNGSIPDFYGYIKGILDSNDQELLYFDTEKEAIIWLADHYYRNLD
jgi:hypothetical protein